MSNQIPPSIRSNLIAASLPARYSASMAPLVRKTRTEVTVTYISADWDELVDLLTAPLEYIRTLEFLWKQKLGVDPFGDPVDYVGWQMIAPITAIIEPIGLEVLSSLTAIDDLRGYVKAQGTLTMNTLLDESPGVILDFLQTNSQQFMTEFGGMFIVKFSLFTSIIKITYIPPAQTPKPTYDPSGVDSVSLVTHFSSSEALAGMDIHFDFKPTPRDIANFLVNLIQSPTWFPNLLTGLAHKGQIVMTEASQVTPENVVNDAMFRGGTMIPKNTTFTSELPGPIQAGFWSTFASVTAQGLSSVAIPFACGLSTCVSVGTDASKAWNPLHGGTIALSKTVTQIYHAALDLRRICHQEDRLA